VKTENRIIYCFLMFNSKIIQYIETINIEKVCRDFLLSLNLEIKEILK